MSVIAAKREIKSLATVSGFAVALACGAGIASAIAGEVQVAVAANFTNPAKDIAAAFEAKTGDKVLLSFGASGALYAQITQGAPFAIFLSADATRPETAEAEGFGVEGSRFTYAVGQVVLWSAQADFVDADGAILETGEFAHLAIANPETAPYGAAAVEAMTALGVYDGVKDKIVMGENIAQTFQFVASGNAELGFVARSQVGGEGGSQWVVPTELYAPILQDAVLLKVGADDAIAKALLDFLKGPEAAAIIEKYGYGLASR